MKIEEELKKIYNLINEKLDNYFSPNGKKIFIGLVCAALAAIIFLAISFSGGSKQDAALPEPEPAENVLAFQQNSIAEAESMTEIEIDDIGETEDKTVVLNVEEYGRANPFLPADGVLGSGYALMAPPESLSSEESEAAKVITTKVSGIMYEPNRPSAILNIEGEDYLVRSGDYINNYKILSISKDLVTVQLGVNVYKAGVGQVIADGELNYNKEDNLEHKFGGAKI